MNALTQIKNVIKNLGYAKKDLAMVVRELTELRAYADRLENTIEIKRLKIERLEAKK